MYRFADIYDIYIDGNDTIIVGDEIFVIEDLNKEQQEFVKTLKDGISDKELLEYKEIEADEIIEALSNEGIIKREQNNYIGSTVERQVYYFENIGNDFNNMQCNLENKTVCIIGLGGVGSVVLQHLIGSGIKNFILIDYDIVDETNLNRQFIFNKSHIGKSKTDIARNYLRSIDPSANIKIYNRFINDIHDMKALDNEIIDILVCAADIPIGIVHEQISRYCFNHGIAHTFCGVGLDGGYWGPLLVPGESCSYESFMNKIKEDLSDIEKKVSDYLYGTNKTMRASFGPVNSVISSFLVYDVVRYLAEIESMDIINIRNQFNLKTFENVRLGYNKENVIHKED